MKDLESSVVRSSQIQNEVEERDLSLRSHHKQGWSQVSEADSALEASSH